MRRSHRSVIVVAAVATLAGLLAAIPVTASADPGVADHLAFTVQPIGATADDTVAVEVTVQDSDDVAVPGNTDSISLTLDTGTINAGGDAVAADGVASFELEIHQADTYTITAHDETTTLPDVDSNTFTISPGLPDHLAFGSQPSDTYSARSTDPSTAGWVLDFTVEVHDVYDNLVDDNTDDIHTTLSIGEFSDGTRTQTAVAGIAMFDDLKVLDPGAYTITADDTTAPSVMAATSDSDLSDADNDPFDILPHADLQLTMTSSGNHVAGLDQTYTVHVENFGPNANNSYEVTAALPSDVTFDTDASSGDCTLGGGDITCTRSGEIASGDSDEFDIVLAIHSNYSAGVATRDLSLTADLTDTDPTQDPANSNPNGAPVSDPIHAEADLGIAVTTEQAGPTTYPPLTHGVAGTDEIFHMTTTDYGPSDNDGFTATLTVPDYDGSKLTLVSAPGCTGSAASHTVTCTSTTPLSLSPANRTYDITFHIAPNYTNPNTTKVLSYSAALSGLNPTNEGGSPTHANSTGSQSLTVDSVADVSDVSVTQTAEEQSLASGAYQPLNPGNVNSVLYRVTVWNHGPSDAQNATLKETLPSTLQVGANQIKYCIDVSLTACTPTTPYATNGASISLGTLAPDEKAVVRFQALLIQSLRRGGAVSYPSGNATAVAETAATDPDNGNNTSTLSINLYTVPDAPTILQVQPGDKKIGVLWQDPATGGSSITGYDFIANGTAYFVPWGSTTSLPGGKRTAIFPVSPPPLTNGTTYTVTIEARNEAGDSNPSSALQATPCSTCVISQLTSGTQTTLLSSQTSQVITNPNAKCFPQSNSTSAPGATTTDRKVSCFQVPASVATAKAGSLIALRDEAPDPANGGDCPDPAHPCLGNQVSVAIPPGTGTSVQFTEVIIYDRTISTDVYGTPCTKTPCGGKYEYRVYMRPSINVSAVLVGSSIPSTWCKKNTSGLYIIPSGKPGCVVEYTTVNTSTNPSDNGNTSNGKEGNGDLRLTVVFWGDPRTAP